MTKPYVGSICVLSYVISVTLQFSYCFKGMFSNLRDLLLLSIHHSPSA